MKRRFSRLDRSIHDFAPFALPALEENVEQEDFRRAEILDDPRQHRGVLSLRRIVQHRRDALADTGGAEPFGQRRLIEQAAVVAERAIDGQIDRAADGPRDISSGGADRRSRNRISPIRARPPLARRLARHHRRRRRQTFSNSVMISVGRATVWVTGDPSTRRHRFLERLFVGVGAHEALGLDRRDTPGLPSGHGRPTSGYSRSCPSSATSRSWTLHPALGRVEHVADRQAAAHRGEQLLVRAGRESLASSPSGSSIRPRYACAYRPWP